MACEGQKVACLGSVGMGQQKGMGATVNTSVL